MTPKDVLQITGARFDSFEKFNECENLLNNLNQVSKENYESLIDSTLSLVKNEILKARKQHPKDYNSCHEGYAIISEELDELWDEIKIKESREEYSKFKIRNEAIQVACTTIRFIIETTGDTK